MKPKIKDELLDELLKNYSQPSDLLGPDGLLTELKKQLINRVLDSELTHHLGYEKHHTPPGSSTNARHGIITAGAPGGGVDEAGAAGDERLERGFPLLDQPLVEQFLIG